MCAPDEAHIIELARQQDRNALNQLIVLYERPLLGFILRWVSRQDAEDVAQAVWIRVCEEIHRSPEAGGYDPTKGTFYTWVIGYVAKPKVRDWRRSMVRGRKAVATIGPGDEDEPGLEPEAPEGTWRPDRLVETEEELRLRITAYVELFRLTFLCGGYPHEQLAFGFAKLLHGTPSSRAMEGVPDKIDHDYGERELRSLAEIFWQSYRSSSGIRDRELLDELEGSLGPLHRRLRCRIDELIRPFPNHLHVLQGRVTGQTSLRNYYAGDGDGRKGPGTHPITHWCYRLRQRLMQLMGMPLDADAGLETAGVTARRADGASTKLRGCSRCKLRHVPPCSERGAGRSAPDRKA